MALTIEQISSAIIAKGGNISDAANSLGVTRQALHLRIQKSKVLAQLVTDAREEMVDIAESEAKKQIKMGNTAIIIFTLKTLGKSRGYTEQATGAEDDPLHIKVIEGPKDVR